MTSTNLLHFKERRTLPLKVCLLRDLPRKNFWDVWAKKIDGMWLLESPAVVAEIPTLDIEFQLVGTCIEIERLKDDFLKKSRNQDLEQLAIDVIAHLNTKTNG